MKNKLTKQQLKSSLGDNYEYYAKYLEKFNNQGGLFFSWNWAAFLITVPWVIYRKQWGIYFFYFFGYLFYAFSYFVSLKDNRFEEWEALFYIVAWGVIVILMLLQMFLSNYLVLRSIQKKPKSKRSKMYEVIVLTILTISPAWVVAYDAYKEEKRDHDKKLLYWSGGDSLYELEETTEKLSDSNMDLIYQPIGNAFEKGVGCKGDIVLLQTLEKKGLDLGKTEIIHHALKCHNKNIVEYVIRNSQFNVENLNPLLAYTIRADNFPYFKWLLEKNQLNVTSGSLIEEVYLYVKKDKERYLNLLIAKIPLDKRFPVSSRMAFTLKENSVLNIAIKHKDLNVMQEALDKGADINWKYTARSDYNTTHLKTAIESKSLETIEWVLSHGFNVNQQVERYDGFFENYLHWYLKEKSIGYDKGYAKVVSQLIDKVDTIGSKSLEELFNDGLVTPKALAKVDFKAFNKEEWKMLFDKSCRDNNLELFDIFLDQGGKLEEYDFFTGDIWGCNYHTGLSKLLRKHHYDFNRYNTKDLVLVNYATKKREGYEEVIKILLKDKTFDLTIKFKGETILHRILRHPRSIKYPLLKEVLVALKERGELEQVINTKDNAGVAPIHITNNSNALKLLIEYGANVTLKTNEGHTVLDYIEEVEAFDLVSSYFKDTHPQKVRLNCNLKVRQTYTRELQSSCKAYASTLTNVNAKSYYLFLAGEFEAIKNLTKPKDIESSSTKYEHFYANLGHAYLLTGEFEKADDYYQTFIKNARKLYKFTYKSTIRNDFKAIQNLYGDKAHEDVTTVFDKSYAMTEDLILNDIDNWNFISRHIVLNGERINKNQWRYQIGEESFVYDQHNNRINLDKKHPYFLAFSYRQISFVDIQKVVQEGHLNHTKKYQSAWEKLNQMLLEEDYVYDYRQVSNNFWALKEKQKTFGFERVEYRKKRYNLEALEITHKGKKFLLNYRKDNQNKIIWFDFDSSYDAWTKEEILEIKALLSKQ